MQHLMFNLQDGNDDEAGPSNEGATAGGGDDAFAGSDEGEDPLAGLSSDEDEEGANVKDVVLAQFEKVRKVDNHVEYRVSLEPVSACWGGGSKAALRVAPCRYNKTHGICPHLLRACFWQFRHAHD